VLTTLNRRRLKWKAASLSTRCFLFKRIGHGAPALPLASSAPALDDPTQESNANHIDV